MIIKLFFSGYLCSSFLLQTCFTAKPNLENIDIVITTGVSNSIDLKNEVLTIYFMTKDSINVKFHLTKQDKEIIAREYSLMDLKLDGEEVTVSDMCMASPKIFTKLYFKSGNAFKNITIDTACDHYYVDPEIKGSQVKDFVREVSKIIFSKKEVREAPKSDIIYF